MDELEQLVAAICELWAEDPTAPSLVSSRIKPPLCGDDSPWSDKLDEQGCCWYGSIVRYEEPFAQGRRVVAKAWGRNLPEVYAELAKDFALLRIQSEEEA